MVIKKFKLENWKKILRYKLKIDTMEKLKLDEIEKPVFKYILKMVCPYLHFKTT